MIRVGMVTTISSQQRCGIAEYSRMLRENMDSDIDVTEIGGPYEERKLLPRVLAGNYDIVHFQYESGFLGIFTPGVARKFGSRIVITLHDAWWRDNRETYPFVNEFDRVVVHQETGEGFVHIPHGIPVLTEAERQPTKKAIGTAGFPLSHKGILLVAMAATLLDREEPNEWGCTMVCPESQHVDTFSTARQVKAVFPQAYYETVWLPQLEVMKILSGNLINVFPYRNGKPGISAAVRMGLATGSHMVLSKSTAFMDLWDNPKYCDEIGWIEGEPNDVTPRKIVAACRRVLESGKRPRKILEDMSWKKAAAQYAELYRGLM